MLQGTLLALPPMRGRECVREREREGSARKIAYIVGALAEEGRLFGMILSKLDGSEFIEQRLFAL